MKHLWSCHRKRLRLRGLASLPSLLTSLRTVARSKYAPSHRAVKRIRIIAITSWDYGSGAVWTVSAEETPRRDLLVFQPYFTAPRMRPFR